MAVKILHIVPGLDEYWNGMAVAAKLLAGEQDAKLVDAKRVSGAAVREAEEVWVHSCWTPWVWRACWLAVKGNKRLVRMLHGNLDPVRLRYHGWKKRLVGPIERFCLRRSAKIVATCEAEKGWIQTYLGKHCPPVEVTDIKRFFDLNHERKEPRNTLNTRNSGELHVLYLGRSHPLKGLEYLVSVSSVCSVVKLKIVSNAFGEEKEKVWDWCDVLVLPTLSDNFGLVIAEALERGKRVITTDGAPAWSDGNDNGGRLIYLKGFRDGTREMRIELLKNAIEGLCK